MRTAITFLEANRLSLDVKNDCSYLRKQYSNIFECRTDGDASISFSNTCISIFVLRITATQSSVSRTRLKPLDQDQYRIFLVLDQSCDQTQSLMSLRSLRDDRAGGEECFSVDEETGVVRTRCASSSLKPRHEYEIGVSAVDMNGETTPSPQKSPTQSVKIFVGERDPQFFELQYVASVPEGSPEQFK